MRSAGGLLVLTARLFEEKCSTIASAHEFNFIDPTLEHRPSFRPALAPHNCPVNPTKIGAGDRIDQRLERYKSHRRRYSAEMINRSEEHTSELQSLRHLVCRLLLVKTK